MKLVRRLYAYFWPYRKHLALSLVFVLLLAAASGALVYLGTSLLSSLFGAGDLMASTKSLTEVGFLSEFRQSLGKFVDSFLYGATQEETLFKLCVALLIVTIAKNLFFYLQGFFAAWVEQGITRDLRNQIYDHLLKLPLHISIAVAPDT